MGDRRIKSWLMDMDGVLVREEHAIPGADASSPRLRERGIPFLVLTNNSIYTRRDLAARLRTSGLDVPERSIWTSALATARFLEDQRPGGSGVRDRRGRADHRAARGGLHADRARPRLRRAGRDAHLQLRAHHAAIRLIDGGARFIATNPDATGPTPDGPLPATGSVAALISRATGVEPYFVGKPNPLMMRSALNAIDAHSEDDGDDRRPHGHRHRRGARGRARDDPRAHRLDRPRGGRALPVPPVADRRRAPRGRSTPMGRAGKILVATVLATTTMTGAALAGPPTTTTGAASDIGATTATLNATVLLDQEATIYVEYGTTTAYGSRTPDAGPVNGNAGKSVSADLTGLAPSTTYHARVVAVNVGHRAGRRRHVHHDGRRAGRAGRDACGEQGGGDLGTLKTLAGTVTGNGAGGASGWRSRSSPTCSPRCSPTWARSPTAPAPSASPATPTVTTAIASRPSPRPW